jgi:prephenate dehydratase
MLVCLAAPVHAQLGYLGPRGTFSELAAERYREASPSVGETLPFETMTAVVEALREGRIARGILPVASTVAGFPAESSRLFLDAPDPGFRIVAELVVPVELHLMVKPGAPRESVREILSHPNALGEARAFLDAHYPGIPRRETASTAAAAERVAKGDGGLAAVASLAAARLYGLEVLDRAIQEDSQNATSFWVLAHVEGAPAIGEARRLVLLLEAPAGSDVLSETLARLHEAGLGVVFVESTPLPGALYGFRYLISLASEEPVATERVEQATGGRALRLGWF